MWLQVVLILMSMYKYINVIRCNEKTVEAKEEMEAIGGVTSGIDIDEYVQIY